MEDYLGMGDFQSLVQGGGLRGSAREAGRAAESNSIIMLSLLP